MSLRLQFWVACLVSGLVMATGGFVTMTQAQDTDPNNDLNSFLQRSDQPTQQMEQLAQESPRLGEGLERLGEVPAMGVVYRPVGGPRERDKGQSDLETKAGTLWDEMPSWLPYFEASFRGGSAIDRGEVDLFMPLIWSETSLLFADLRGSIGDTGHHEGNWALASRHLTDAGWILGAWGSYDLRESETGNHFDQAAFGVEMLSDEIDFRFNGYTPTSLDFQLVPGAEVTAAISGDNIVVRSNRELAYWGVDGEFGLLLWSNDPGDEGEKKWYSSLDAELRWFAGGYYFDNPTSGFDTITGPRVRAELRMYDLALLGTGSRLTLEGLIQDDHVRGTQAEAGVYLRIPFGLRPQRPLDRMQRRMVDRIVRDVDVVAHHQTIDESASFESNGIAISKAGVVNADDDLSDEVAFAGANSLVVVDGTAGDVSASETTVLSPGQVVLGGGTTLNVVGRDTGLQAVFEAPGTRPTVTGVDASTDVFEIDDDTSLVGLDIRGGYNGVSGESLTGFTLRDLNVSGATNDGFHLIGDINGTVSGNTATSNGDDGFAMETFNGGTLSGNTATSNSFGFYVVDFNGGTLSDNTASSNSTDGFSLVDFNGGTVSGNTATSNGDDGFAMETFNGGTLSGNTATSNSFGFYVLEFNGGTINSNAATNNGYNGFWMQTFTDGTVSGNTATGNDFNGFYVQEFAPGNTVTFSLNEATANTGQGYDITGAPASGVGTNTGSGNGSHDSF